MAQQNQTSISWEAWEYKYHPKNLGWYIAVVCVFILMMAFFIIVQSDIFAAVSLGLIGALVVFFAGQAPGRVNIELSGKGVHFGNLFYPYKQLKYFWVVHNDRHQTVNFQTSALINNTIILELEDQDPEQTRLFLLKFLPEHSQSTETHVQRISHRFKF